MAVEACADVASHLIADRRLRVPSTYAEIFEVLVEAKLLDAPLRDSLVRMVKFRNILVHDYAPVDPAIIVRVLSDHLGDFGRFRDAVLICLQAGPPAAS
jgi:uncharacterized protein YutE (UPF0331/DUF86 family)